MIDGKDKDFASLAAWRDLDQDGQVDSGEISSLNGTNGNDRLIGGDGREHANIVARKNSSDLFVRYGVKKCIFRMQCDKNITLFDCNNADSISCLGMCMVLSIRYDMMQAD